VRIIAGIAGGRRLHTLSGMQTRPTADRVKEAIFSILLPELPGSRVLDAFAGSGALGLESLSRGAESAWLVEKNRAAANICQTNIDLVNIPGSQLFRGDVLKLLPKWKQQQPDLCFDIIFADPPYAAGLLPTLFQLVLELELLSPEGVLVAETAAKDDLELVLPWQETRHSVYGDTAVHYCRIIGRE